MIHLTKALVPVDFSEEAALAVDWTVNLLKEQPGAKIVLLHTPVYDSFVDGQLGMVLSTEPLRERARHDLENWRTRIPPPIEVTTILGFDAPIDDIITYAKHEDVDLIVMTTSGRRGLARLVHPNITEHVVRAAPCPVMALHVNLKTWKMARESETPA